MVLVLTSFSVTLSGPLASQRHSVSASSAAAALAQLTLGETEELGAGLFLLRDPAGVPFGTATVRPAVRSVSPGTRFFQPGA